MTDIDTTRVRDLIVADPAALGKWALVVDHIVLREDDKRRIKALQSKDREYGEAILESLNIWRGYGAERVNLLAILRGQGLNNLAAKLQAEGLLVTEDPNVKANDGVWFEVDEVLYNFTGREAELEHLHKILTNSHSAESTKGNIVSICGLGGIGKSSLAKKYAFRYRSEYNGNVAWINAETAESMRSSFHRLANQLGIPASEKDSNQDICRKVYEKFQDRKSLLIFDNVEENSQFKEFQPKIYDPSKQTPYILVTTRRNDIAPLPGNQLNLDVLEMEEAVRLIQKQLPEASDLYAEKLAETLQRLPLALQQGLAYIREEYSCDSDSDCISKYLRKFETSEKDLLNDERFKEDDDYSRTTFTTWSITLARITTSEGGKSAIKAMQALAYLNPDLISVQFVRNIFEDELGEDCGLKLLKRFSMISIHHGKITIHRLVQMVVRLSLSAKLEISVLEPVIRVIHLQFQKYEFTDYTKQCMSHGLHLFPFQVKVRELMKERSFYLGQLCYFLLQYGNDSSALSVAERSSSMYESMVGKEHQDTIKMKWRTADAHYMLDNYPEAMNLLESILPISKSTLGDEHWLTMNILEVIARTHTGRDDDQKAITIYDEIIPVRARLFGEHDDQVLIAKVNKADALRKLGQLGEALELSQYVYEKRVELNGKNDLRTLRVRETTACVFNDKGDLRKAIEVWTEVYEGYKQEFGETHLNTIIVTKNIEIAEATLAKLTSVPPPNLRSQCHIV